jgi:CubicO group peptidase (beta-lactamase class C family)
MSIFERSTIVAALTLMACVACAGESTSPNKVDATAAADSAFVAALRAKLTTDVAAGTFSGAVLVTRNGKTVFEGAYGLADREKNIPNTPQTQFRAGSMYKMMTAVATLQLVQEGKLRLDATVGTYLPDYPNADVKSKVTLHHLLTHTGGTGDIFGPEFTANRLQLRNVSDYIQLYGARGLQFTPGAQHVYSNYGFILLGAIIERVTGKSYDDHVGARVLAPAGMTSTGTAPEDSLVQGRAVGYMRQGSPIGPLVSNVSTLPYRGSPAGGGYSTVGDFASFAVAVRDRKLLDSTYTTMLYTGKVQVNQAGTIKYAYGFMDRIMDGRRWVGHGGSAAGMNGELVFEPNGGYVIVVLTNFDPPSAGSVLNFIVSNLASSSGP